MDIPSSRDRIEEYTKELQEKYGVKLVIRSSACPKSTP